MEQPFFINMQYKSRCVRFRMKFTGVLLVQILFSISVIAQQDTSAFVTFEVSIPAGYNLSFYTNDSARLQAFISANAAAQQALQHVNVQSFAQEFPASHYQYLRNVYTITCANDAASIGSILSLHSADPVNFEYVKQIPPIVPLGTYTPNDYHGVSGADCSAQLNYINAPAAWGVTKGNPAITIGINDPSGFDVKNPDLVGKIIGVDAGNVAQFHGTSVAGCAAAHTDNGIGVAAIGFNCTLLLDHRGGDGVNLQMSGNGIRVINNSWFYGFDCSATFTPGNFIYDELVYDEIYENGTSICFAAGNGLSGFGHCPSLYSYAYPVSLDHIITVGPVSCQNPLGTYTSFSPAFPPGGIPWLWKDCHEESPGYAIGQFETLNYEANERVDISAPAYNVASTYYDPNDSSAHYLGYACGTSFASPIVAGTIGLILSANACLSPYQTEYLLKTSARNIDFVEYPPGSGINLNANYVGKMGSGALDAGAAVTAASNFNCNDTATQTLYIAGVELNTICASGHSSNGLDPVLYPVIQNGTPPYTYRWDPMPSNNSTLSDYASGSPTVVSGNYVQYRLGVYDHSTPVPKEASRIIQLALDTLQTPLLTLRDSYMDMLSEPNTQANTDGYDWQIGLSPDILNRLQDDHIFVNQNPVYTSGTANYVNARVRNVGCAASTGAELLNLYWTKAGTMQSWPTDWTTGKFTNTATGASWPAGGQITATPVAIPVVAPGGEVSLSAPWYPPNPANYDASLNTVDVSLLGRIETTASAPYGMTIPEGNNTASNIINNNKIATHNLVVNNPAGDAVQWHQVLFANTENYDREFTIEIGTDKQFHPSFSGDMSAYAKVEVQLGDLYDRWVAGGSQGNNISVDGKNKSVIFTGENKIILNGITIHANEKLPALVGIFITQQPLTDQYFHIRQLLDTTGSQQVYPYGNISFLIPGCSGDTGCAAVANPNTSGIPVALRINVFPNPVSNTLTILYAGYDQNTISYSITDQWGQRLLNESGINVGFGSENYIDVTQLSDGVYFLKVTDKYNSSTVVKIVKD